MTGSSTGTIHTIHIDHITTDRITIGHTTIDHITIGLTSTTRIDRITTDHTRTTRTARTSTARAGVSGERVKARADRVRDPGVGITAGPKKWRRQRQRQRLGLSQH